MPYTLVDWNSVVFHNWIVLVFNLVINRWQPCPPLCPVSDQRVHFIYRCIPKVVRKQDNVAMAGAYCLLDMCVRAGTWHLNEWWYSWLTCEGT